LKKMGRWVCVYKHYPQWLLSTQHARVLIHWLKCWVIV
jgi:hypothetical protein